MYVCIFYLGEGHYHISFLSPSPYKGGAPPPPVIPSSNKLDVFNHPDSDDPVAQTLYRMIEPDDKVRILYQYITRDTTYVSACFPLY